jgi:alpha-beta hydrolase superfamily lysophospholipase
MEFTAVDAVVGSSLGGLVALEVVKRGIRKPLVLIAPALGIADLWLKRMPPDPPLHRAFFEQMSKIRADDTKPGVPVTLIMGKKDESIPFDRVAGVWRRWQADGPLAPGSRFVQIAEGDHRLTAFVDILAREIRAAVSPRSDILSA